MNGAMRKEAGVSRLSVIWSKRHDPATRLLNVLRVLVARSTTMPDNDTCVSPPPPIFLVGYGHMARDDHERDHDPERGRARSRMSPAIAGSTPAQVSACCAT
jgi:hypothetical protein